MVNLSDGYETGNLTEVRKSMGVNPRAGGGKCFPNSQGSEAHGDEKPSEQWEGGEGSVHTWSGHSGEKLLRCEEEWQLRHMFTLSG